MITVGDDGSTHPPLTSDPDAWPLILRYGDREAHLTLADLKALGGTRVAMRIECVSAGFIAGGRHKEMVFEGIPMARLLERLNPGAAAQTVILRSAAPAMGGPSGELHETSLEWTYCRNPEVLVAWGMNGEPLPYANGGPLRTTVGPDRYFYKALKWLREIELTDLPHDQCRGTWETYGGYHNVGRTGRDPEERFEPMMRTIESVVDAKDVTRIVPADDWARTWDACFAQGDMSRLVLAKADLMHIPLDRDFSGMRFIDGPYRAKIRGTLFKNVSFLDTDFRHVNFSLSRFPGCRFSDNGARASNLSHCDMEGAHFTGADLTGVVMREACLTGVHFYLQAHREKGEKRKAAAVRNLDLRGATNLDPLQAAWLKEDGALL